MIYEVNESIPSEEQQFTSPKFDKLIRHYLEVGRVDEGHLGAAVERVGRQQVRDLWRVH